MYTDEQIKENLLQNPDWYPEEATPELAARIQAILDKLYEDGLISDLDDMDDSGDWGSDDY